MLQLGFEELLELCWFMTGSAHWREYIAIGMAGQRYPIVHTTLMRRSCCIQGMPLIITHTCMQDLYLPSEGRGTKEIYRLVSSYTAIWSRKIVEERQNFDTYKLPGRGTESNQQQLVCLKRRCHFFGPLYLSNNWNPAPLLRAYLSIQKMKWWYSQPIPADRSRYKIMYKFSLVATCMIFYKTYYATSSEIELIDKGSIKCPPCSLKIILVCCIHDDRLS
jgi:hypothetical protein